MFMEVIVHRDGEHKKHKYVARVKVKKNNKDGWRYFYTLDEYREYLKSQKNATKDKAKDKPKDLVSKGSNAISKLLKKADKALDKKLNKSKKSVDKIVKKSTKLMAEKVSKGKKVVDKLEKKASKIATKEITNGKKAVDAVLNKIPKASTNKKPSVKVDSKSVAKGKNFIDKKKSEGALGDFIRKDVISKAVKFVGDLFNKLKDKITNKNDAPDNYKHKVKMPNGTYKYFMNDDEYEDYLERLEYQKKEPSFMKKVKDISHNEAYTKWDDMEKVNETYDPFDESTSTNCANCTAAYELRRRGYDVEAVANGGTDDYNGNGDRVFDYFENATMFGIYGDGTTIEHGEEFVRGVWNGGVDKKFLTKYEDQIDYMNKPQQYTAKSIEKGILAHNPPGSRGMIDVEWKSGGAHSIVYEVDKKGNVTIRDSQTYDAYSLDELAHSVNKVRISRTDNLRLKENILDAVTINTDKKRKYSMDKGRVYAYAN